MYTFGLQFGYQIGKGGVQFPCCKISKTLLFSGNVCSDLIRISGCLLMIILNLNDIAM